MKTWLIAAALALGLGLAHAADDAAQIQKADATAQASGFKIRPVDDAWRAALPRDAKAATQAYLDRLPADVQARSDDYYTGGYWLQLWNLLLGLAVAALMLAGRRAAKVRDWAARVGKGPVRRDMLFGAVYLLASALLMLPLEAYQGWWREQAYGMSTQTLLAWLGEQGMATAGMVVIGAPLIAGLYALFRRAGERWWIWGTVAGVVFLVVMVMVSPVLIDPVFNTYKPVSDGPVKTAVLRMAHATGVPADNLYEFDASRQTTRISANVTGLFGSAAIRLNDNLLRRTSTPEIEAVMAHELGHYVMNHMVKRLTAMCLVLLVAMWAVQALMRVALARGSAAMGVSRVDDIASLPLLAAVFSLLVALITPLFNTMTRVAEIEADRFALSLSREPHGFAEAQLRLVEYRKADPGPVEEFIFFHHPSTRHRIHDAMRWREAMGTP